MMVTSQWCCSPELLLLSCAADDDQGHDFIFVVKVEEVQPPSAQPLPALSTRLEK